MKEKEYFVAAAKFVVLTEESKIRDAQTALDCAIREGQAKIEQTRTQVDRECHRLREELVRANAGLQSAKKYLQFKQAELERGFDA